MGSPVTDQLDNHEHYRGSTWLRGVPTTKAKSVRAVGGSGIAFDHTARIRRPGRR